MGRRKAGRFAVIAVMATALAVAGCSTSKPSATKSPSSGSSSPASPGPASPGIAGPVPNVTGSDVASQIQTMINQAESAGSTPFKADYSIILNGKPEALTLEEKGSNELVSSQGIGEFISTPTTNAFCLVTSSPVCYAEGASSDPLAALVAFAEPKSVLKAIQSDEAQTSGSTPVYTVTMGTQTHNGSPDTCATLKSSGATTVYCFNAEGVVAYENSGGATLTLTSYTTDVPDSDFRLPASPSAVAP